MEYFESMALWNHSSDLKMTMESLALGKYEAQHIHRGKKLNILPETPFCMVCQKMTPISRLIRVWI